MSPSDQATVNVATSGDSVLATIAGEIDPTNAREVGRQLTEAVANAAMVVVVDMTEVTFLDSSGVQMLFEFAERLTSRQQQLSLVVPPSSPARRVLDIVAFASTAPVLDSREERETNGCH